MLIFPLQTLRSFLAKFQPHLHMDCIFLSWYAKLLCVLLIMILLIKGCCCHYDLVDRNEISNTQKWQLVSPHYRDNKSVPIPVLTSITNIQRLCLLSNTTGYTSGARFLTLPEHMNSALFFSGFVSALALVFCLMFSFAYFLLATMLSVFLLNGFRRLLRFFRIIVTVYFEGKTQYDCYWYSFYILYGC